MRQLKLASKGISLQIRVEPNCEAHILGQVKNGDIIIITDSDVDNFFELAEGKGFVQNNLSGTSWLAVDETSSSDLDSIKNIDSASEVRQKSASESFFEFGSLEKKGWAGLVYRPWNKRNFRFSPSDKTLKYYDLQLKQRGALLLVENSVVSPVEPRDADGKDYAFEVSGIRTFPNKRSSALERILLSAPSNNVRSQWMSLLLGSIKEEIAFLDDYFVIECMERFKSKGPGSLLSYDFSVQQTTTLFGIPQLLANNWWEYPKATVLLETHYEAIKEEFIGIRRIKPPTEKAHEGLKSGKWSIYPLFEQGVWDEENIAACPITACLLRELPLCLTSFGAAYFSILYPDTEVTILSGPSNAKLRLHLPISVDPKSSFLKVGSASRAYEEGKAFVFDSCYEHSVTNRGSHSRVALVVDVWHPQLTDAAKVRLEAFFDIKRTGGADFKLGMYAPPACEQVSAASTYRLKPAAEDCKLDYNFQFLMVGESAVGKTCFVSRFCDREAPFTESHVPTQAISFQTRSVHMQERNFKIQLWDMGTVTPYYYGLCQGFFICVDQGSPGWLDLVVTWRDDIMKRVPAAAIVIVSTKADLPREAFAGGRSAGSTPRSFPSSPNLSRASSEVFASDSASGSEPPPSPLAMPPPPSSSSQPVPPASPSSSSPAAKSSTLLASAAAIASASTASAELNAVHHEASSPSASLVVSSASSASPSSSPGPTDSPLSQLQQQQQQRKTELGWWEQQRSYASAMGQLNSELSQAAGRLGLPVVECSSRSGLGVDFCVATLVNEVMKKTNKLPP